MKRFLTKHIRDIKKLCDRVSLKLCDDECDLPTDVRIRSFRDGTEDIGLAELLFNFGRYLMISCSGEGTQPANLQGIWNHKEHLPWFSGYTANINLEMNYWAAEMCNLSSCHMPLLKMIEELSEAGEKQLRKYTDAEGLRCIITPIYGEKQIRRGGWQDGRYGLWQVHGCAAIYGSIICIREILNFLSNDCRTITKCRKN